MKPIFYSLMVCLFVTTIGFSQNNSNESILIGEWVFEFDKSFSEVEKSSRTYLDSIPNNELQIIHSNYQGRKIIFESDGDFIQSLSDGRKVSGKWLLNSMTKMIEIKLPNGAIYYQQLKILDKGSILLTPDKGSNIIINKWYYTKI